MSRKKILVYDQPHIINLVKLSLDENKYNIYGCDSEKEIQYYLKKFSIDCIIIETLFNYSNGYKIINRIKKKNNNIPILILSSKCMITDKLESIEAGVDDYLCKPFDPIELQGRIDIILNKDMK